jgi:hypothetical protein
VIAGKETKAESQLRFFLKMEIFLPGKKWRESFLE